MSILKFGKKKKEGGKSVELAKAKKPSKRKASGEPTTKKKEITARADVAGARRELLPLVTEKGVLLQENGYAVFRVAKKTTKQQIKLAVRAKYKVNVQSIKTMRVSPKKRRRGATTGQTSGWKKAYVKVDDVAKIITGP